LQTSTVSLNGDTLTQKFIEECVAAVSNVSVANGYLCGAYDPLLIAFAAVFRVNIRHTLCEEAFHFSVGERARATVFLVSSSGHMDLERVVQHTSQSCPQPQAEPWRPPRGDVDEAEPTAPSSPASAEVTAEATAAQPHHPGPPAPHTDEVDETESTPPPSPATAEASAAQPQRPLAPGACVGILFGEGVRGECAECAARALQAHGMRVLRLPIGAVSAAALEPTDVLLLPGGEPLAMKAALSGVGARAIRAHAKRGGGLIGICAGAVLCARGKGASLSLEARIRGLDTDQCPSFRFRASDPRRAVYV
jgi:hypothetical protein